MSTNSQKSKDFNIVSSDQTVLEKDPMPPFNRTVSSSSSNELKETKRPAFTTPQPSYAIPLQDPQSTPTQKAYKIEDDILTDHSIDTGSDTDSEAAFDWDAETDDMGNAISKVDSTANVEGRDLVGTAKNRRAKRGRRLFLAIMSLARWVRLLVVGTVCCGLAILPFILVVTVFKHSSAKPIVQVFSLMVTISIAAAVFTTIIVDALPHLFIVIILKVFGKVPENFKSYVELLMAVTFPLKILLMWSWSWITLGICRAAVKPPGSWWSIVNEVWSAIFASLLLFLVERVLLQFIAINFHRKALADRLDENQDALKALDKLSKATRSKAALRRAQQNKKRLARGSKQTSGRSTPLPMPSPRPSFDLQTNGELPTSYPPTPNPQLPGTPDKFSSDAKRSRASNMVFNLGAKLGKMTHGSAEGGLDIASTTSARKVARQLFEALATDGHGVGNEQFLVVSDFEPYFHTKEQAQNAFRHFDKDGNGDISKQEMRHAVQRIYRERKSLTTSLADMSSAVSKLDGVLLGVVLVILIFVWLLIFNHADSVSSLVPLATIIIGFSFIFGNSAKTLFESLIFIFATHPFDVGDLVLIDSDYLFVQEFGLVSTTFKRVDGCEIIAPNALLATSKLIHNVRRSRAMWEVTYLQVGYETPLEALEELKVRMRQYVQDNSREWGGGLDINIDSIVNQNVINVIVAMEHKSNFQDWGGRWQRRTALMKHLKGVLEALCFTYSLPIIPMIMPEGYGNYGNALEYNAPYSRPRGFSNQNPQDSYAGGGPAVGTGNLGGVPSGHTSGPNLQVRTQFS